jgi:hypothetical protein
MTFLYASSANNTRLESERDRNDALSSPKLVQERIERERVIRTTSPKCNLPNSALVRVYAACNMKSRREEWE